MPRSHRSLSWPGSRPAPLCGTTSCGSPDRLVRSNKAARPTNVSGLELTTSTVSRLAMQYPQLHLMGRIGFCSARVTRSCVTRMGTDSGSIESRTHLGSCRLEPWAGHPLWDSSSTFAQMTLWDCVATLCAGGFLSQTWSH